MKSGSNCRHFVLLFVLFLPFGSWGANAGASTASLTVSLGDVDHIFIEGFRGDLKWTVADGSRDLNVRAKLPAGKSMDSVFSTRKSGRDLYVTSQVPQNSEELAARLRGHKEEARVDLEVRAPSLPLTISWDDGVVSVTGLNHPLAVILAHGRIHVEKQAAEAKLNVRDGQISTIDTKGGGVLETYSGQIDVKDSSGRLKIKSFSGKTTVSQFSAPVSFESYKGSLLATQGKAAVDFKTQQGAIQVVDLEGDFAGFSEQGAVSAKLRGRVIAKVETNTGSIHVSVPVDSGARVSAQSDDGRMTFPRNFNANGSGGTGKTAYGRLGGEAPGSLVLRTKGGEIKVQTF